MKYSVWYSIMWVWVGAALNAFYRRLRIYGKNNIPKDSGVLLAPNHQNAFMDAITIACKFNSQISFLIRADVFKTKTAATLLQSLRMMPIYRQRDGVENLEKNEAIFDTCYQMLNANKQIIVFPEGNHNNKRFIRPLKKGVSRIAFGALEKYDFKIPVKIVPIGVNYSNYTDVGADCIINVGEPIDVSDYAELFKENQAKALLALKDELAKRMKALVIHISEKDLYDMLEELPMIVRDDVLRHSSVDVESADDLDHIKADQKAIKSVEEAYRTDPETVNSLKAKVESYTKGLKKLNFRDHLFKADKHKGLLWETFFMLMFFPAYLFGLIHNYIPFIIPDKVVQKKVKDRHFHSSIKIALAVFTFPIFWGLILIPASIFLSSWWYVLLYMIGVVAMGEFALHYARQFKKWKAKMRYNSLARKGDAEFVELKETRKDIVDTVSSFL